ncbi:MAG: DUF4129 domain-containing protein [bacterium]
MLAEVTRTGRAIVWLCLLCLLRGESHGLAMATPAAGSESLAEPPFRLASVPAQEQTNGVSYDSSGVRMRAVAPARLAVYRNHPDFDYRRKRPQAKTFWQKLHLWWMSLIYRILASRPLRPFWRILPYAIVTGAFLLVVSRLLKSNLGGLFYQSSGRATGTHEAADENIRTMDFQQLIEVAIREKHFRRAIRLLYLSTLKKLSQTGHIDWKLDKTNHDYLIELGAGSMAQPFADLTRLFEYIWYGEFQLGENEFLIALQRFREFDTLFTAREGQP